jgi:hypothetical protein
MTMYGDAAGRTMRRHRERSTGEILDRLHSAGWAVFHDVRLPGRQRVHAHHVVVGPPGVFVVEVKNWSGRIEVRDNNFWCRGRRQDRVVGQVSEASMVVAGLVSGPAATTARGVLCFLREDPVAGWCYDVMVCSTINLREMLTSRPPMLSADEIMLASIELDLGFRAAAERPVREPVLQPEKKRKIRQPRIRRQEPMLSRWLRRGLFKISVVGLLAILALSQLPKLVDLGEGLKDRVVNMIKPESILPDSVYESCDALRVVYPNGVGTPKALQRVKGKTDLPTEQPEVYWASKVLDKDHDGMACERGR